MTAAASILGDRLSLDLATFDERAQAAIWTAFTCGYADGRQQLSTPRTTTGLGRTPLEERAAEARKDAA